LFCDRFRVFRLFDCLIKVPSWKRHSSERRFLDRSKDIRDVSLNKEVKSCGKECGERV